MKRSSRPWMVFLAGTGLLLAAPASAYSVKGAGECATWVGGEDDRFWVLGFISGYNFAKNAEVAKSETSNSIFQFVTRYCEERPKDDLADAATAYIKTR